MFLFEGEIKKAENGCIVIIILPLQQSSYLIEIFTHLKLCLADAIHNFKWVKIILIWQKRLIILKSCLLMSRFVFNMFNRWYLMC